jgi:hypothetical protein
MTIRNSQHTPSNSNNRQLTTNDQLPTTSSPTIAFFYYSFRTHTANMVTYAFPSIRFSEGHIAGPHGPLEFLIPSGLSALPLSTCTVVRNHSKFIASFK